MGKDLFPFLDTLLLRLGVLEGPQIIIGCVNRLAGGDTQHGFILIGPEHGDHDRRQRDQDDDCKTHHRDLVFLQAPHAILKGGRGRPHLDHVFLFFFTCRHQVVEIYLHAQFL